mmetsp:Transcript_15040/g.33114  ORF Transcript_15040/g.33114 Transcript_15040/m.33114 type:complete len:90 (+) Transcript_15040:74-343(+)
MLPGTGTIGGPGRLELAMRLTGGGMAALARLHGPLGRARHDAESQLRHAELEDALASSRMAIGAVADAAGGGLCPESKERSRRKPLTRL